MQISGEPYILANNDRGNIYILDLKGALIFETRVEGFIPSDCRGREVGFLKDGDPYLAILANTSRTPFLSQLCIFSPDKKLIYRETLDNSTGICVNNKSEKEVLLVGEGKHKFWKIWEYSLK